MADDLDADWKQDHSAIMPSLTKYLKKGGIYFVRSRILLSYACFLALWCTRSVALSPNICMPSSLNWKSSSRAC